MRSTRGADASVSGTGTSLVASTRTSEIPMQQSPRRARESRAQNHVQRDAREKTQVGFEIRCCRHIGFVLVGTIGRARRDGDRDADDFRAEAAIGPRLGDEHLVAAAGMPCRMKNRHRPAGQRQNKRHGWVGAAVKH